MDRKLNNQSKRPTLVPILGPLNQEDYMSTTSKLSKDQTISLSACTTTSSRIRYLNSIGWDRSAIAKKLGKRYQHVRNVLITPVTTPRQ